MKPTSLVLLAPLALASFGFSTGFSTMEPQQPSAWRQSKKSDAANGTTYTRFTLPGKFLKSPPVEVRDRPALVLDCVPGEESRHSKGRFLAGNLAVGPTLKIVYVEPEEIHGTSYYPKISVRYRMDNAKEERENWSAGTEKTSASIPEDSLKKILRAHTVEVTVDDAGGLPVVMQFDMPDPAAVEAACNVDEPKK